ncbi:hypothetical protein BBO99_00003187 [Phytophthora kernoviae]|uniref:Cytochrome P450 n=2 Tax=Phytophthora kernoviae TaxID=325452 RepID=A0A3R7KW44_9STRA|nr:hypothetical protein G195_002589 [Phytophthora kernoviae 00238/432]KAG2532375.1 hypothetical protein JM16_000322 [Phytophthora kernoviae]KAG2533462.1 hypothetical protein JM18_000238 [Phytophthora kernoviae]RLN05700.1 hypothetical protein BBI17_003263 [Phytophthora kernoviae]RLN82090.1 hypothetical protein BBO99_00003187 [Phytophthora kernoviae]
MWTLAQHSASQQSTALAATAFVAALLSWKALAYALRTSEKKEAVDESFRQIHRPKSTLPVLGNTLDAMYLQTDRFVDWMSEQSALAGGKPWLMTILGQPPMFVISSPESYEDLFKTQLHIFERGETMSFIFKDFLGEGIIAVDGHKWQQQRKTASHLFTNRMMCEVMTEEVRAKAVKLRDLLDYCALEHKAVSMKSLISKFTSDVFTKIGFGVELHGLEASKLDLEQEHPFIQAIDDMSRLLQLRFMMNRYPDVLRKIREEIHEQLPELVSGEIDAPSMEQLSRLPYLEAAMRENLRLNTSMTTRSPNQDTTLSCGTFIPKNSIVYVCHYASARLKSTWGEDAAEYKPERWLDPDTGKLRQFSPFKFVTFLAGPRQCIGMRFAMLELRMVAAVLFNRFDIKTVENPFDLTYELSTVFPVKGRLLCKVERVSSIVSAA